ncbi:MAG: bifunctional riboflavin kinase/FAD synthetase [Alphaproteobacteria bacterium]|nr:bifunctional riboflavin kinase/FAD synthetase [Alphaproteobacteria bacterium]
MRFFHTWKNIPNDLKNGIVALGNFDGFHLGHKAVLNKAISLGNQTKSPVILITFEPHPSTFFRPSPQTFRITPIRAKTRAICNLSIDAFFVFPFTKAFSQISAFDFINNIIIKSLSARAIVVGEDYTFGNNRIGDINFLQKNFPNLPVYSIEKIKDINGETISSSRIRAFIHDGNMDRAQIMMGHPFEIEGYVIHGNEIGRTIGYPTINLMPKDSIIPAKGVYKSHVNIDGKDYLSIANIGSRPTVNGEGILAEAHILNFNQDLYGKRVRLFLDCFIRPEKKFSSINELKKQIDWDMEQIKRLENEF